MEDFLSRLGWVAERFPAKTVTEIEQNYFIAGKYNRNREREKACATSHLKVYEKALKEGHKYIMVLEDDICTDLSAPELEEKIKNFLKKYPDFEQVNLGKCFEDCSKLKKDGEITKRVEGYGAFAYLISQKGMQKMLATKHNSPIDNEFYNKLENTYVFHPNIIYECPGKFSSTIDGKNNFAFNFDKSGCKENFGHIFKRYKSCISTIIIFTLIFILIFVFLFLKINYKYN